mmetsp:Transcript_14609/g.33916  ORF Transcript_14609/g.33916 Transcript_14609/m.33916 type:complete len:181 (-) Transcript_14609:96-638(-)
MQSTAATGNPKRGRRKRAQFQRFRVFWALCHCGELAANGSTVKSRSAEDVIRVIGQTIQELGCGDPGADSKTHKMDAYWTRLWKDWKSYDNPPKRVKPIPLEILLEAQRIAEQNGFPAMMATGRMGGRPTPCSSTFISKPRPWFGALPAAFWPPAKFSFLPETRQSCLVNYEQTDGLYKD